MTIFNKIINKLRAKKRVNFKSLFNTLKNIFKFRSWKSKALVVTSLIILIGTSLFVVYGQTGGTSTGSSLTKGLIAHYTLDAQDYEEGTVNLFPRAFDALAFLTAYNGSTYGFGASTNIQQVIDNTLRPDSSSVVTKVSRINSDLSQRDYVNLELASPLNSTRIVSFWYYGTFGSTILPYNNDSSANLFYLNDSGEWIGGSTSVNIPVPINQWKKIVIKMVNRGTAGTGFSWFAMHNNANLATLSNQEYWAFTEFQVEEKAYVTSYTRSSRTDRAIDKTPYERHGSNYGSISAVDRHGKENGAMSFDGTNDYIQTPISGTFPQASFCFWGFFDDPALNTKSRNESAFGDWISSRIHFGTRWSVGMHWNVNSSWTEIPATNLVYGWNHYCLTWNNSTNQKLVYINNILSSSNSTNGSIVIGDFKIGNATNLNYYYRGNIDDFRMYNRAISAEEVALLYSSYEPKVQVSSINAGLIGHWTLSGEDFNSTNNRVTDKTPYERHGTNSGATLTTDRHGKANGAMSFNGSSINITNRPSLDTNSLSISFWAFHRNYAYPKTFGAIKRSSNCYAAGGRGWDFGHGYNTNGVDVCVGDGTNIIRTPLAFNTGSKPSDLLNKWAHIVYIIDRNQNKVSAYVNGTKQSAEVNISSITGSINANTDLSIGSLYGWIVDGVLNDIRMYNRAISEEEVLLLYNSYMPQTGGDSLQKGLVLDMPLTLDSVKTETTGSQIITDRTPYSNDGINSGALISSDKATFNGSDSGIIVNNFPQIFNGSVTLSTWAYFNDDTRGIIFGNFDTTIDVNLEKHTSRRLRFYWNTGQVDAYSSVNAFELNKWNHLVLMRNKEQNRFEFWVNGVLVNTVSGVGSDLANVSSNTFRIGRDTRTGETVTNGSYADLKIYNRTLSEEEIKSLYNKTASVIGGMPVYRKSCKEILAANPTNPSGVYQIQPITEEPPFSVYCDMTTDGGGWTLVEKDYGGSATVPVSSANDTNTAILTDQTWSTAEGKFADSKFKAIWLAGNRELLWRKSTGEYVKMRFSADFINSWFSNFAYTARPTGVFQEFYRYADSTWYAINGHYNNWHFSNYNDGMGVSPFSSYRQAKNQNDVDSYWPTRSSGLMDNTSFMFHMYIR